MCRKRKTVNGDSNLDRPQTSKLRKTSHVNSSVTEHRVPYAILTSYYPKVLTLREFLLSRLPSTSTGRRKKIVQHEIQLTKSFLDDTLIGILKDPTADISKARHEEYVKFSQTQQKQTHATTRQTPSCCFSELVDFATWLLFNRSLSSSSRSNGVLCHGLQRAGSVPEPNLNDGPPRTEYLPGILIEHPNENRTALKASPWTDLPILLGSDAESILLSLLLDCGIFKRRETGHDNYFQLSGTSISDLRLQSSRLVSNVTLPTSKQTPNHKPNHVRILIIRFLYAQPSVNQQGNVIHGLPQTHALHRHPDLLNVDQDIALMKSVFPRQFRLPGVSGSDTKSAAVPQTAKEFIHHHGKSVPIKQRRTDWLPHRLRYEALQIVRKLRRKYSRFSPSQLLRFHCPMNRDLERNDQVGGKTREKPSSSSMSWLHQTALSSSETLSRLTALLPVSNQDQREEASVFDFATPAPMVSAFCQNAISRILPGDCLGQGAEGKSNHVQLMRNIDRFVRLRKFEYMTLHEVIQGINTTCISWTRLNGQKGKICATERKKSLELIHEFVYYIFEFLVIPLIRANFYVTESGIHRNRMLFFRHDVWLKLCEPTLASLRFGTFEALDNHHARHLLKTQSLGSSRIRFLPKEKGLRTITNLARKPVRFVHGIRRLGQSINGQLSPVFHALNYEKSTNPLLLGTALSSVGDLHHKLEAFARVIRPVKPLYFVKVDIQSCFDNIPHQELLSIVDEIFHHDAYRVSKSVEIRLVDSRASNLPNRPVRRFVKTAQPLDNRMVSSNLLNDRNTAPKHQVVVGDTGSQHGWQRTFLRKLLHNHIRNNIVKIGRLHLRQTNGIPQGSVLSTMLCNMFYSSFEEKNLHFIKPEESLLLRMIDDFLLITTSRECAVQFLTTLHNGNKDFGIFINSQKTLVNFDVSISGHRAPLAQKMDRFPYCGTVINTRTLEVGRNREKKDAWVENSLTVSRSRQAGSSFQQKMLAALKMQLSRMMLDVKLNGLFQILATLLGSFTETAMKMHRHMSCLRHRLQDEFSFIKGLVEELIVVAYGLCCARRPRSEKENGQTPVYKAHVSWTASIAFQQILERKQSQYKPILVWLRDIQHQSWAVANIKSSMAEQLIRRNREDFKEYIY